VSNFVPSARVSTSGLSVISFNSCVVLLLFLLFGATVVLAMLVLRVFAAFWAAEKTDEKNPPALGVVEPFSGVGVNGADVIFDNLLGPSAAELDLTRRCDIIFPEGEVTTFAFLAVGSEFTLSRPELNRFSPKSVGVGGVLTIVGALERSLGGGVCGVAFVSMDWGLECSGLSGDEFPELVCCPCLSNILDTTLPRLLLFPRFSLDAAPDPLPPTFRSGLPLGLAPRRGLKASFNLPTGDGDRRCELSGGARRLLSATNDIAEPEAATSLVWCDDSNSEVTPSNVCVISGTIDVCSRGEEDVRYPMWDACVDNVGLVSSGLPDRC
jgi:hypothetical protein